ncbi:hypothetical protein C8F01DRAFT_994619 [Mycena amicta]|nr:hypothetical protein C8F01DRAFT_994619 [Mycena amicta]
MTFWVDAPGTVAAGGLSARACATDNLTCATDNVANTVICRQLINSLDGSISVGNAPRSICLGQSNNQCCISWSAAVGTLTENLLVNAAVKTFGECWNMQFGSRLARNVLLNDFCVTQYLSNRPDGCN